METCLQLRQTPIRVTVFAAGQRRAQKWRCIFVTSALNQRNSSNGSKLRVPLHPTTSLTDWDSTSDDCSFNRASHENCSKVHEYKQRHARRQNAYITKTDTDTNNPSLALMTKACFDEINSWHKFVLLLYARWLSHLKKNFYTYFYTGVKVGHLLDDCDLWTLNKNTHRCS